MREELPLGEPITNVHSGQIQGLSVIIGEHTQPR